MAARHFLIRGRVQGVGFRYAMCREAQRLGLAGWVRNRHDGAVEAVAAGNDAVVEALHRWAQRGPGGARVESVEATTLSADALGRLDPPLATDFRQIETV